MVTSEIKILKLMLERKQERFTIKKIADTLNINYRIAYEKVLELEREKLIQITKAGHSKICELTNNFNEKIFIAEYERRQDLFKNKDFLVIYNHLAELNFSFIALLFGSHAKGTSTKHSDIDLLTIGGNEKEITVKLSILPDKIHVTHVTYESFIEMALSKEFTVVSEAIKNNIILNGIEDYYRLQKNAR